MLLDGDLTLQNAEDMRRALMKAIIASDNVTLTFNTVTDVDLSSLQLLCSAHRSAVRLNKRIAIRGEWPELFQRAVDEAGYARSTGCRLDCENSCLWVRK